MPDGRSIATRQTRFDKNYNACGHVGHPEETRIVLAIHIWVKKCMTGKSEEDMKVVLDNWLEKNKKWVGNGRSVSTIFFRTHGTNVYAY